jgi:hypothetical protein
MAQSAVLPIHQVAQQLPLRDWLHLCDEVDRLCGKTEEFGTTAVIPGQVLSANRQSIVRFDVLEVLRAETEFDVTIRTDPRKEALHIKFKAA